MRMGGCHDGPQTVRLGSMSVDELSDYCRKADCLHCEVPCSEPFSSWNLDMEVTLDDGET